MLLQVILTKINNCKTIRNEPGLLKERTYFFTEGSVVMYGKKRYRNNIKATGGEDEDEHKT